MLESKASQFTLSPEGKILWQEKLNNPLPGVEVACLVKGEHPLRPQIELSESGPATAQDQGKLKDTLNIWFNQHLTAALEPLMLLGMGVSAETQDDPAAQISQKVYDCLGIVPREDVESFIEKLDAEKRIVLRNKKIRLGPILVFIPALNKPAAVRLRGLLWCLYNQYPLPAKVPADGIVSQKIETEEGLEAFYRSIGYPLYGGRAVRIDMLDRVISSIYDNAKDGVFEARHEMAEWLGTPIEDLYKILEAMGHKKIKEAVEQKTEALQSPEKPEAEKSDDNSGSEEVKAVNVKPALAKFRLKRGKAFQKQASKPERKDFKKPQESKNKPEYSKKDKPKSEKPPYKKNKHKDNRNEGRVITLEAKKRQEDSPFAILQQLIVKKDV